MTVVPEGQAVDLPDDVSDDTGACLGIPGITAHRAVFADGPVAGQTVLVHGILGGVGSLAAQLALWGGATVMGTVRRSSELSQVPASAATHAMAPEEPHPPGAIRALAPAGVDRIVEVAFSGNVDGLIRDGRAGSEPGCSDATTTGRHRPPSDQWNDPLYLRLARSFLKE